MIDIGICDDEPRELDKLRKLTAEYGSQKRLDFRFHCFSSGETLLAAIGEGLDIIFLDIYMDGLDGLAVARKIRAVDPACTIIFATNSREHAIDGYGVCALHYLLKPISRVGLGLALDRAIEATRTRAEEDAAGIHVQNRHGSYKVYFRDLVYAESNARIVTLHLRGAEDLSFYSRLDAFEERCADKRFFRCHKSFLVNLDHVKAIVNDSLVLVSGEVIHISGGVAAAKEAFAARRARRL